MQRLFGFGGSTGATGGSDPADDNKGLKKKQVKLDKARQVLDNAMNAEDLEEEVDQPIGQLP